MRYPRLTVAAIATILFSSSCLSSGNSAEAETKAAAPQKDTTDRPAAQPAAADTVAAVAALDTALYDAKVARMINGDSSGKWPVKTPYPLPGAILPFKTVIAFYGNLYSKQMGVLGEYPREQMLTKLRYEIGRWKHADSTLDIQPALHYIAVTAQGSPGKNGKYRLRMPFSQIDSVLSMAHEVNGIVFLDLQVGLSNLHEELPLFEKYLSMPEVHLGIDPEFSMKTGKAPGKVVGTFDAEDVNYASDYLAKLVKAHNLPPKILTVHRFTQNMITNYRQIKTRPEVQVVMHMDGWGEPARKINTYKQFIYKEPVQFTGFKLFYKNDVIRSNSRMMTPEELLKLKPRPVYIQYQ